MDVSSKATVKKEIFSYFNDISKKVSIRKESKI